MLKIFPDKSSNLQQLKKEITEIKQENEQKNNLLGELLTFLRLQKNMSALMSCRQINKIEEKSGVAVIYSDEKDYQEMIDNEKIKTEIDEFFKTKGLSYKLYEKEKQEDPIQKLKELFGDKLKIV